MRTAPAGIDSVTAEHLYYGEGPVLIDCLSDLFCAVTADYVVPAAVFTAGLLFPIIEA